MTRRIHPDFMGGDRRCLHCGGRRVLFLPCRCDAAQEEARRIMADRR
jgi:hypothetical protein